MNIGPKIKFIRGLRNAYDPDNEHKDGIYFSVDTQEILLNGVCCGSGLGGEIKNVTIEEGNILTVVYSDKDKPNYTFDLNKLLTYASAMPDDLTTPNTIGGLKAGVAASELKKKSVSQILDDILFPELQPTVTAPTASITFIGGFSNNQILEVGSNAPQSPTNFVTSFNRGVSKVAGKTDIRRAGELIDDAQSFIYYGGNTGNKTLPDKVTLGQMTYNYQAHYGEGEELVTSKGNKASITPNPLPAGTIKSGAIQIFGTYPYFCNGEQASSSAQDSSLPSAVTPNKKLNLQKWSDSLVGVKFAPEAATGIRMIFEFPATKKITKVEYMNTVSGKWETFSADEYIVTTLADPKEVQGANVTYKQFTTKETTPKKGALQVRFTLANA